VGEELEHSGFGLRGPEDGFAVSAEAVENGDVFPRGDVVFDEVVEAELSLLHELQSGNSDQCLKHGGDFHSGG